MFERLTYKDYRALLVGAKMRYKNNPQMTESLNAAIDLLDLRADGRLVVLPCKVGDSIWLAISGQIREYIFMGITQQYGYLPSLYGRQRFGKYEDVDIAPVDSIGKTVFLTREEAEKAIMEAKRAAEESFAEAFCDFTESNANREFERQMREGWLI